MKCWNCGIVFEEPAWGGKIPFRASCEKCHADLHCCRNCVYYKPGLPNDCAVPGTDFIPDRSAANFCEEFKPHHRGPITRHDPSQVSKKLFGDEDDVPEIKDPKKRFDSLFQEEDNC